VNAENYYAWCSTAAYKSRCLYTLGMIGVQKSKKRKNWISGGRTGVRYRGGWRERLRSSRLSARSVCVWRLKIAPLAPLVPLPLKIIACNGGDNSQIQHNMPLWNLYFDTIIKQTASYTVYIKEQSFTCYSWCSLLCLCCAVLFVHVFILMSPPLPEH